MNWNVNANLILKETFTTNSDAAVYLYMTLIQFIMKAFTFDQIPIMMKKLFDKLEHLEKLVERISPTLENKDELLNVQEASKLLNLSVSTIYSKVCRREIPVNKKGKRIYFCRNELLEWIRSGRVKTYAEIKDDIEKRSKI